MQDCTKFPRIITDAFLYIFIYFFIDFDDGNWRQAEAQLAAFLQIVKDIINRVCYQRFQKGLEHQNGRPNVNICVAEENFEEEL